MFRGALGLIVLVILGPSVSRAEHLDLPEAHIGETVLYGAQAGQPQVLSAAVTLRWKPGDPNGFDKFLHLEPGLTGGKAAVGIGGTDLLHLFSLRATFLRTWWRPWGARPSSSYIGTEFVLAVHPSEVPVSKWTIGVLRSVSGDDGEGADWLFSWSVGWGL